jgi:mono/diheme cytochrome c family protein
MMRRAVAALALVWVLIAAAGSGDARADAARGLALAERWCSQCHGVRPGDASPAPEIPTFPAVAAEPSATAMSLRVFLRTPHPNMPNLILQQDDIDDLVDYILSLKPAR